MNPCWQSLIRTILISLVSISALARGGWVFEVLHEFERPGVQPLSPLLYHSDGSFYGTTVAGGAFGHGAVIKVTPGGVLTTVISFTGSGGAAPGHAPVAGVVEGPSGELYGTTTGGGASGFGLVFKLTTGGVYTKLVDFTGSSGAAMGSVPAGMVLHPDGKLYGLTQAGGASGHGTVYSLTTVGVLTTLLEFTGTGGATPGSLPTGALVVSGGDLYGVTQEGGASDLGTVYRMTTAGARTGIAEFDGSNGALPAAGLTTHSDGSVYGLSEFGGTSGFGTAFKVTTGGSPMLSVLRSFDDPTGSQPVGRLIEGGDGALYGATSAGGSDGWGTVFRLTTGGAYSLLAQYSGEGGAQPGSTPRSGPVIGPGGDLFGATSAGGPGNLGVVYQVTTGGAYSVLADCSLPLGWYPSGAPVDNGSGGILFPMGVGGSGGGGTLVSWSDSGGVVLAGPIGATAGEMPDGGLAQVGAEFFGVTAAGGSFGKGTAFKYAAGSGVTTVKHFTSAEGSAAEGLLVEGGDGALYGVAREGGATGRGTVYRLTTAGVHTPLISFSGIVGAAPGRRPQGGLAFGSSGDFYGLTEQGGSANSGVLFRISSAGAYTLLDSFVSPGAHFPRGGLVAGLSPYLFGTTSAGGTAGAGTVIRVDTMDDSWTTVAEFSDGIGALAGREPAGELAIAADGAVWGTFTGGGTAGVGGVFTYASSAGLEAVVSFSGYSDTAPGIAEVDAGAGVIFTGGVLPRSDGTILGVVPGGGVGGGGTLFRLRPHLPIEEWKLLHLGAVDFPDLGDPDRDGLSVLIEYALQLLPEFPDPAGGLEPMIKAYPGGDRLAVVVPRDPARSDITVVVESAPTLQGPWTALASSVAGGEFTGPGYVSGDGPGAGVKSVEVRDLFTVSESRRRFLRIRVWR